VVECLPWPQGEEGGVGGVVFAGTNDHAFETRAGLSKQPFAEVGCLNFRRVGVRSSSAWLDRNRVTRAHRDGDVFDARTAPGRRPGPASRFDAR